MKKILLIFLFTLAFNSYAQKKGCLSISGGGGITLGAFTQFGQNPPPKPPGSSYYVGIVNLSYDHILLKNFGITSLLRAQYNEFLPSALNDSIYFPKTNYNFSMTGSSIAKNLKSQSLMLGTYYSLHIGKSKKNTIEPKVMVGITNSILPQRGISAWPNGMLLAISTNSTSAQAVSYLLGITGKFGISSKLFILVNIDYTSSSITFKGINITRTVGSQSTITPIDNESIKLNSLTASLGIGIKL